MVVINGSVQVNGDELHKRDAVAISGSDEFSITAMEESELLAIEVPMN